MSTNGLTTQNKKARLHTRSMTLAEEWQTRKRRQNGRTS